MRLWLHVLQPLQPYISSFLPKGAPFGPYDYSPKRGHVQ